MPTRAVLFDFDGTLADSFGAIAASTNHVRRTYGLPELPEREVRRHVGLGLEQLMADLVPNAPTDAAVALYREHHATVMLAGTKPMPGVLDTVATLASRGYRLAVCSNKRVEFTRNLVDHLGLRPAIAETLGPDDVGGRAKPDPAMLLEALRRLGDSPAEAVYVGDMAVDVHAARAAGVPVWLVLGGAAGLESAEDSGPDRVLGSFAELANLLPKLG
ncbi:MAG TPA: HAD-IA family hydrolase [Fimbriiglobus sp.]|jgi:phosphoglycolate phosphatase|nr:HAD-IA family hydrolase [Fimbriiglobus sp.]